MMDLKAVDSSVIAAAGYEPETLTLVLLYNTGRAYEYQNVPAEIYEGLMQAESKGRYLNEKILGIYPYRHFRGWKQA